MSSVEEINTLTSVDPSDYEACLDVLEHKYTIKGVAAKIRMHYIKFDGNGQPMIKALADMLYNYIIDYCIAARNRPDTLNSRQSTELTKQARELFRHPDITDGSPDNTGEAGEMLLYFLMEAVIKAPQMVSKMELKTNNNDEVKGSDGIHARFDPESNMVDFFFGESKLYREPSAAIAEAIKSVGKFHKIEMYQHEFNIVTKHFKYADEKTRNAISSLIVSGHPGPNIRVNHACLIGYDFKGFSKLSNQNGHEALVNNFVSLFLSDGKRLTKLLQDKFNSFEKKHLCFDVFFIPFPSVSDFRKAFNEALD